VRPDTRRGVFVFRALLNLLTEETQNKGARAMRCLDHVVPRVEVEDNSYRNLVSCCVDCNSVKRGRTGKDFVRWLRREGRLNAAKLADRLRALDALASGKLRPPVASMGHMATPL
jgi:hypothetical protein